MVLVRAVYQDGKLQLLDDVHLQEGQEVQLHIVEKQAPLRERIGDMLTSFDVDESSNIDEEALMQDLDKVLRGKRPLSEIILEERREGR